MTNQKKLWVSLYQYMKLHFTLVFKLLSSNCIKVIDVTVYVLSNLNTAHKIECSPQKKNRSRLYHIVENDQMETRLQKGRDMTSVYSLLGVFMMFSTVLAYFQLGQFLTLVMAISWLFATFFFMSLCHVAGPVGHFGRINSKKCCSCDVNDG